jgi:hypothetical protein
LLDVPDVAPGGLDAALLVGETLLPRLQRDLVVASVLGFLLSVTALKSPGGPLSAMP